jgi:hypothetical protein
MGGTVPTRDRHRIQRRIRVVQPPGIRFDAPESAWTSIPLSSGKPRRFSLVRIAIPDRAQPHFEGRDRNSCLQRFGAAGAGCGSLAPRNFVAPKTYAIMPSQGSWMFLRAPSPSHGFGWAPVSSMKASAYAETPEVAPGGGAVDE